MSDPEAQRVAVYAVPPPYASAYRPTNTLAIIALVLSFFAQVPAVVCGHLALAQIRRTGEEGRGLAVAALVIGYAAIGLAVLFMFAIVVLPILFATLAVGLHTGLR